MSNGEKLFVGIVLSFILGFVAAIYVWSHWLDTEPKQVMVEVPQSLVIEIPQKYNLTGTEYTKRVLNDITITSYNNHTNQTDNSPNITATNRPVRENMVAASPDLLTKGIIRYGDLVYIDCMKQWYVVEDTMNKRFERRLDIFLFSKDESLKINKKCNIEVLHINK